ncbi:MAG: PQQ-dependent sugar dehydrogenase [Phycisphaerales bacterium]
MHTHPRTVLTIVALLSAAAGAQQVEDKWNQSCASCHGDAGQGGEKAKSLLTVEKMSQDLDRPFFEALKPGLKGVEGHAFADLSDKEAWSMVVHLREAQQRHYREKLSEARAADGVYESGGHKYKVETVIKKGLEVPWGIEFMPDGRAIITERKGSIRLMTPDFKLSQPLEGTPKVLAEGQGGLMDVALHPDFATNGWVYIAFSDPGEANARAAMTKVVRGKVSEEGGALKWTSQEELFKAKDEHYLRSGVHHGSRIVFQKSAEAGKYYMYFSIGERGHQELAQDRTRPNGKVHRLWDDGKVPTDNPFVSESGAYPSIWSFGHRNPQGLVFDLDGKLWDTEHAPRGGDELNLVVKGANYGWPLVSFGINYNDTAFRTPWPDIEGGAAASADIHMPAWRWLPSIGACGLSTYKAPATGGFPKWNGDLFAGGLSGSNVDRLRLKDGKLVERKEIMFGKGRVRDVLCGPDGNIWVTLESPGRLVKISPAD